MKIREFREGISVKFRCTYCSIIGEILHNEPNCHCEFLFRLHENSAQNLYRSSTFDELLERKDERNKAKGLKIMIIIKNL